MNARRLLLPALSGLLLLPWSQTARAADAAALFQPNRVLDIRVEIAPADWEALRKEHHDLLAALGPGRVAKPEPKPYKTYRADVTIDGVTVRSVGLHKRGFLGSASMQRPSLGIRFDAYDNKQAFSGTRRMSLNNNLQDPSQIHQAMAYRVFAAAGVPAPRCNFARVTVNGKYLGVYSHIEPVEAEFLQRHFGEAGGNLYEGLISDFRPEWVKTFEKKNHKTTSGRGDLEAVTKALASDDAHWLGRVEQLLDVEAYLRFWAVETVLGHWDSYSNNGNNFFLYAPVASGKFRFIPWGADSVFGDRDPFTPFQRPESVQAMSLLPRRLYRLPATRDRYRNQLREVLKTVWNERDMLAEVDRLEALLNDHVTITTDQFQDGLAKVRGFVRTRRAALEKELAGPAPEWTWPLKKSPWLEKVGTFQALFQGTWRDKPDLGEMVRSAATMTLEMHGKKQDLGSVGVSISPATDARIPGAIMISLVSFQLAETHLRLPVLIVQSEYYKAGATLEVDGFTVSGGLLQGRLLQGKFGFDGLFIGTLRLMEAGTQPGATVSGKVQADIYWMTQ